MSPERLLPETSLASVMAARAREHGARTFLEDIHSGRTLTYAELAGLAGRLGAALDAARISPGGRVVIDVAEPVDFSAAYIGIIAAGRCALPVNPQAPVAELERHVTAARPDAVISDRSDRASGLGLPVMAPLPSPRGFSGSMMASDTAKPRARRNDADVPATPTSGAVLLLTSGSTGAPKAVVLAEDQLLHVARAVAAHNRLTTDDRGFNPLPLFHINAQIVALLASLMAGAELVLDCRFRRHGFWEALADRDVTWLNLVPAILTILAEYPVPVRPRRLRFIRCASAPLPGTVRERIAMLLATPVVESYGMTEAASQITAAPVDGTGPAGSCGRPVGTEIEVRDAHHQPVPFATVGEIWIRGAGVIDAYDGGRDRARFDALGWLDTGDRGYVDKDGFLFLAGRSDDVINRGGEMLYPREIEEVLVADRAVMEAVVVGRPDAVLGQVPVAYVVPARGRASTASVQELRNALAARCAAHLSRYKVPVAIRVVEDLPRGATGKVQRRALGGSDDRVPLLAATQERRRAAA